jgi:hypothetical protein
MNGARRAGMRFWIALYVVLCCLMFAPVSAQDGNLPTTSPTQADGSTDGAAMQADDSIYYYAFLEQRNAPTHGPAIDFLRDKPFFRDLIAAQEKQKFRPMVQWFYWANQRHPFGQAVGFLLLSNVVVWALLPERLRRAETEVREKFWRSFGYGVLVGAIAVLFMRTCFLTMIGWPLGILVGGALLFAALCGLAVTTSVLGRSITALLRIDKLKPMVERPDMLRLTQILVGVIVCALLLQIGGAGDLPKIGTRLVALFAILGIGALFRTRSKPQDQG